MIEIYINNEKTDVQLEDEKTVGDILNSFEQTCEANNAAVIGILVNGKQITAEIFDAEAEKPLEENMKFEFSVITSSAVKQALENLSSLFSTLAEKMQSVPAALQNGKNAEVGESIKNLADSIDQFCHIAALASLFPEDFDSSKFNGFNFQEFIKDFSPILADFEEGLKNNDTVLIGDLAEYEICPRLQSVSQALKGI